MTLRRRSMLREIGAAVALPWLDAMLPALGHRAAQTPVLSGEGLVGEDGRVSIKPVSRPFEKSARSVHGVLRRLASGVRPSPALERYNDTYRTFAKLHDLTLLDHHANWIQLKENDPQKFQEFVPDGSHPSKEGSLAVTWPTVKAWLENARRESEAVR